MTSFTRIYKLMYDLHAKRVLPGFDEMEKSNSLTD